MRKLGVAMLVAVLGLFAAACGGNPFKVAAGVHARAAPAAMAVQHQPAEMHALYAILPVAENLMGESIASQATADRMPVPLATCPGGSKAACLELAAIAYQSCKSSCHGNQACLDSCAIQDARDVAICNRDCTSAGMSYSGTAPTLRCHEPWEPPAGKRKHLGAWTPTLPRSGPITS